MRVASTFIIIFLAALPIYAEDEFSQDEIRERLTLVVRYMEQGEKIPDNLNPHWSQWGFDCLPVLEELTDHRHHSVRDFAYSHMSLYSYRHPDSSFRSALATKVSASFLDEDPEVRKTARLSFMMFDGEKLDEKARRNIAKAFDEIDDSDAVYQLRNLALLCGLARVETAIPRLRRWKEERDDLREAAMRALARYGGEADIRELIESPILEISPGRDFGAEAFGILAEYIDNPPEHLKKKLCRYIAGIGRWSEEKPVRHEAVRLLISALSHPDLETDAANELLLFIPSDFNEQAREQIGEYLADKQLNRSRILLAGLASRRELIPRLSEIARLEDPELRRLGLAWHARLALARLGDEQAIEVCVRMVEAVPEVISLPVADFAYVRQPAVVKALQPLLERDDSPGEQRIRYAPRALEVLAASIEGFPVRSFPGPIYFEFEIRAARRWMRENPDFKVRE